jgi:hypothetical protein
MQVMHAKPCNAMHAMQCNAMQCKACNAMQFMHAMQYMLDLFCWQTAISMLNILVRGTQWSDEKLKGQNNSFRLIHVLRLLTLSVNQ